MHVWPNEKDSRFEVFSQCCEICSISGLVAECFIFEWEAERGAQPVKAEPDQGDEAHDVADGHERPDERHQTDVRAAFADDVGPEG